MKMIAAVDAAWGIGYNNKLLVSIPEDMKFFRKMTEGKAVICGRRTLQSFPQGKPLKNKLKNVVLTKDKTMAVPGAEIVHSVEEALEAVKDLPSDDVMIIGGEAIYRAFLPYCDTAYITRIDYKYAADAYFPNLDEDPEWELVEEGEEQTYFDLVYNFTTYKRK